MNKSLEWVEIYAQSFFLLCQEKKLNFNNCLQTNTYLIDILTKDKNLFWNWIQKLDHEQAKKELKLIFADNIDQYWLNLIYVLVIDYKINLFLSILFVLEKFFFQKLNIKVAYLYSVFPLSQKQLDKITSKLMQKLNCSIKLISKLDKSLLAGVKIELDDWIFDNSLQKKLIDLKKGLIVKQKIY